MKVEEAKTKVCPFIQRNNATNPTITKQMEAIGNIRVIPKFANITCICGDCMAWVSTLDIMESEKESTRQCVEGYCARIGND